MRKWKIEVTNTFAVDTKARGKALELISDTGKSIAIEIPREMSDRELLQTLLLIAESATAYVKEHP